MKKFRLKHSDREATISTAALPDIIFMLLFFFMVTTVLRKSDDNLKYKIPTAEQIKQIEKKSLITQITIGTPKETKKFGSEPRIEADGKLIEVTDIVSFIMKEKDELPTYNRDQIIILLKADEDVPMGIVSDVTQELRKANARRIIYAAKWKKQSKSMISFSLNK
ncbi:MAG: biopolymer transporter ExbD [Cyclobacteriaceae bacterium]|nr:biopolymer transporter ExbD [Cyclobacteriaceae bacterium]